MMNSKRPLPDLARQVSCPMPSNPEGLAIARARIAAERENPTGFLDLGRLGLVEVPEELFALEHLWGLNWGWEWPDDQDKGHAAKSDLAPNGVEHLFRTIPRF